MFKQPVHVHVLSHISHSKALTLSSIAALQILHAGNSLHFLVDCCSTLAVAIFVLFFVRFGFAPPDDAAACADVPSRFTISAVG
jgi:hypothetical protein